VLDVGCGPGGFTAILAENASRVVGVDVSDEFVDAANRTFERHALTQANAVTGSASALPFDRESFDVVTLIDVLHHLDDPPAALAEVERVLRPGGRVLVFEPNKLNPLLTFLCLFDRNEYGFLKMGRIPIYERLLSPHFRIESASYSGLLIGPDGPAARAVADSLQEGPLAGVLGWLSPKLFFVARKP
jgi:ubiquinone/menaquinone biosynthesis C-methylase UbiE